jgi:hypothetical protein
MGFARETRREFAERLGPSWHDLENGFSECTIVNLRCRRAEGREIAEAAWQDRALSTRRWYRLDIDAERWLPEMYVRLVRPPGETTDPILPDC